MQSHQPLTIYLDSSDYSTLSNPHALTDELREVRCILESAARTGVKFVYSGTHLYEMSPTEPTHVTNATERAQLLVCLSGRNALISFDRLLAAETSRLLHADAPPVQPYSDDGTWFPPIERLISPVTAAATAHDAFHRAISNPSLTGQQRKHLTRRLVGPDGKPRPALVKLITDGLLYVQTTPEGKKALSDLYQIDGLAPGNDADYDVLRQAAKVLNLDLEQQIAPPPPKPAG